MIFRARYITFNQDNVTFCVYTHDFQVLDRDAVTAHTSSKTFVLNTRLGATGPIDPGRR